MGQIMTVSCRESVDSPHHQGESHFGKEYFSLMKFLKDHNEEILNCCKPHNIKQTILMVLDCTVQWY